MASPSSLESRVYARIYPVGELLRGVELATTDLSQAAQQLKKVVHTILQSLSVGYQPCFFHQANQEQQNAMLSIAQPLAKL